MQTLPAALGVKREREGSDLTLAHCRAHVRRKFVAAEPHYPEAGTMIDRSTEAEPRASQGARSAHAPGLAQQAALAESILDRGFSLAVNRPDPAYEF